MPRVSASRPRKQATRAAQIRLPAPFLGGKMKKIEVLVGRGVVQSLQFVQVLELHHDNAGRGCSAFVGDSLTAAHNEFAARVGNRLGYEGEIFLIVPVLVLDCDLSDVVGGWAG